MRIDDQNRWTNNAVLLNNVEEYSGFYFRCYQIFLWKPLLFFSAFSDEYKVQNNSNSLFEIKY